MEINPSVVAVLKSFNIDVDEGLMVLLGIYYRIDAGKVLPEVTKEMYTTGIVDRDEKLGTHNWNVALFKDEELIGNWSWVVDWMAPFEQINKDRAGSWRDCIKRMQKFFSKYPEYRKNDVYAARNMYLRSVTDKRYLMHSHKFIFDGVGAMEKSTLLAYCEKLKKGVEGQDKDMRGRIIS